MVMNGMTILPQEELAREPMVQNLMVIILSEFAPMEMMKLEIALKRALTTTPDNTRLVVVIFLPAEAITSTMIVAMIAPRKAPKPIKDLRPRIIKRVAPKVAPAEIPNMYGSDIGLFTVVCIVLPQSARPAPAMSPMMTRGLRIFHTIAIVDFAI